ncbi:MAG: DNA mismatch repair protein MutS [Bacteroidetes bacterium]|nr:DNA mismatch repair protein MutS [Bacteroidota bacterium]
MKQYYGVKEKYPDALVLFRVGDFYETFNEDAVKTSKILGIVLTKRSNGTASEVALAGFPHHSLETYLPKLVKAGQRVAVCDQLEDPKMTKTIVKRGVTEVVTPGVAMSDKVLDHKSNNYLASVCIDKNRAGLALVDISTGEFYVTEGEFGYISKTLNSFLPKEVLFQKNKLQRFTELFGGRYYTYGLEDWVYGTDYAKEQIQKIFETDSLKGFGIEKEPLAVTATGSIIHYLHFNQQDKLAHINKISKIVSDDFVWLDPFTIRNLELVYSANPGAITLLDVIDQTLTPMGGRMLRKWMVLPLKDKDKITYRHALVGHLLENKDAADEIRKILSSISDIERIASKIAMGRVSPREIWNLKYSLQCIEKLKSFNDSANIEFKILLDEMDALSAFVQKVEKVLYPDAPSIVGKGRLIADGVHAELDEYRKLSTDSKNYLLEVQQRESESTGISSLKIAFNNVFGYYIEVRNTHKDKVPETWIRKQTLVNAERYITEELKIFETKILEAEDKINGIEFALFNELVSNAADYIVALQRNSDLVATLDCLSGFAKQALDYDYVRPEVDDSLIIDIKDGRHPVIEKNLPVGEKYVANDIYLDDQMQQIIMVTGPNMSGKSALLRQTALIVLMAQIGSYVPAKQVKMGVVDKIFTRVGASDNISTGESTFMVEMNETANILNNLSERSLILLDEIGRGTSTYDGISIAWSIAEYLHEYPLFKAKTLFATHYHELNEMTNIFSRIKNFNVSVKEIEGKIIFLRKLAQGGSEHSFGIHVAKLAGLPKLVISNANAVLERLEKQREGGNDLREKIKPDATSGMQLSFIQLDDPVLEEIRDDLTRLNINTLTPVEALMKLSEIKKRLGN